MSSTRPGKLAFCFLAIVFAGPLAAADETSDAWLASRVFPADEARQAAAADERWVYAITNAMVAKYDRQSGHRVASSTGEAQHLNSGFLWQGRLYCAHSNYPQTPERSEIKVLDPASMQLATFKDFGNYGGSLTWNVYHDGAWWCNFARYGADNAHTFLVKFDAAWNEVGRWTYPSEVTGELGRYSISGGVWRSGQWLVTGHDDPVLFRLRLPAAGSVLEFAGKQSVPFTGQGIANDPQVGGLVGIDRAKRQVVFATALAKENAAEVRVENRDELIAALRQARPGVTIRLAAGTYRGGLSQANLHGTAEQPIVICAADPAHPPVIEGASGVHLSSPQHVELRDLVISGSSGNGLNIDDSGQAATPARGIVLRNIVVQGVGPTGNRDGIKLSGVTDFRAEGCRVLRWGNAGSAIDMVGCHRGLITDCTFADATGDAANGVQAKGGSSEIVVRQSRFQNAGGRGVNAGGSTGAPYFRPAGAGYEARNITVEDCEFLGVMAAVAFVGVDGALVQHNTIYRPRRWALRILQENTEAHLVACRNGRFLNNIVAFRSDEVRDIVNIGPRTEPETFEFQGNLWHCLDRPADTQRLVRLPAAETAGTHGVDPGLIDPENGDLRRANRKAQDAGKRPAPTAPR